MKKIIINFVLIFSVFASNIFGAEINNITPENFSDSWYSANDGDVLLLESGEYAAEYKLQANKVITVKASEGADVIFKKGPGFTADGSNTGIIMDGVIFEYPENLNGAFIYLRDEGITINTVKFLNCTLQNSGGRNFMNIDNSDCVLNELLIDGCIFKDSNDAGANFLFYMNRGVTIRNFTVSNSTFYNLDFRGLYTQESDINGPISVLIENNTIYNWNRLNDYLINFWRGTNEAVFTINNNIFAVEPAISKSIFRTRAGTYTYNNNLTIGYDSYATSGNIGEGSEDIDALEIGVLSVEDIGFADPDNGDFSINSNSPVFNYEIGDPRWIQTEDGSVKLSEVITNDVQYYVNNGTLFIENLPDNSIVELFNMQGQLVNRVKTDGSFTQEITYSLIVRIISSDNNRVFKVLK